MGEPMPLSIPRYDVVRNGSALPVRTNRIAFEALFFAVRRRTLRDAMWSAVARSNGRKANAIGS
jgi:hypothetical protein